MRSTPAWRLWLGRLGPLCGLLVVWSVFAVVIGDRFWGWENGRLMLLQTSIVATAAVGATLVIVAGAIDLSVGSAIALGTVVIALGLRNGIGPLPSALLGITALAVVGACIGLLVTGGLLSPIARLTGKGRVLALSPFIVTLAMWGALRGLAKGLGDNSPVYIDGHPWLLDLVGTRPSHGGLLADLLALDPLAIAAPSVWCMLALAAVVAFVMHATRFGRHVFAVGSNEETARLCGVPVARVKVLVFVVAGACAGIASVMQLAYLGMGDPTTAEGHELRVIAAVVIGGASLTGGEGSILGTLVGALLMTVVDSGCTKLGLANWVQEIVTGGIILLAVIVDRLRQRTDG